MLLERQAEVNMLKNKGILARITLHHFVILYFNQILADLIE
jgi:hypothetical protein